MIEESRRQQQVGKTIQRFMADIFLQFGSELVEPGAMITVASVRMTRDLKIARIYLSIFNAKDKAQCLININQQKNTIKRELGNRIRNKVRNIPDIEIFLDDTLDEVMKLEDIFSKIKEERTENPPNQNFSDNDYKNL